jgi:hypothetical protein
MTLRPVHPRRPAGQALRIAAACAALAVGLTNVPAARADNIDDELVRETPRIWRYLREQEYENVGVLTFRVRTADGKTSFRSGLISNNMAERLENALVLTMHPEWQGGIIHDASNTARTELSEADYRTPGSRKRLFDVRYRLPIETDRNFVSADGFLTGKVSVSEDLATTTVRIEAFDKKNPEKIGILHEFDVKTDRYVLTDLGYGFSLSRRGERFMRGFVEDDIIEGVVEDRRTAETRTRSGTTARTNTGAARANGAYPPGFPVKLTVRYDNREQTLEPDPYNGSNNLAVRHPNEGQKVTFIVKNMTDETVGIVLRVNGVNTLYEQQGLEVSQMTRWVLQPGTEYGISGFYQKDKTFRPFVGLSRSESELRLSDLGGHEFAGLVHLHVFRESRKRPDDPLVASRGSLRWIPYEQLDSRPPRSWAERRKQIRAGMSMPEGRGLIAGGSKAEDQALDVVGKLSAVTNTDTLVIRYYIPTPDTP